MSTEKIVRCSWANSDELMSSYHDNEWGIPVKESRSLWETLQLEGFQAGLSWSIILKRREAFREAFKGFDPVTVSRLTDQDVAIMLENPGIIRSKSKIVATIGNARAYLEMQAKGEDFSEFVWQFVNGTPIFNSTGEMFAKTPLSDTISVELKRRGFKFVGPVITYAWMQAIGLVDDHDPSCFKRRTQP